MILNIVLLVVFVLAGFSGLVWLELSRAKRVEAQRQLEAAIQFVAGDKN